MFRSWLEGVRGRVRLTLYAEHVRAERLAGRRDHARPARADCGFEGGPLDKGAALTTALGEVAGRGAEVTVELSDKYARLIVLPWSAALATEADWQAFAAHRFERVHGEAAAGWQVRLSPREGNAPRVACAVDAGLPQALRATIEGAGYRMVSMQPRFAARFDLACRAVRGSSWFATREPGGVCLGLAIDGQWRLIRQRRGVGEDLLARTLEREARLAALEQPVAAVRVVCGPDEALPEPVPGFILQPAGAALA